MEKWHGKYAVVTGASSGIGEAIMKELARNGINVIALARREEKIQEILKDFGTQKGKIFARKCDVSSLDSIKETFKWIEETFGEISILINNAGVSFNKNITDESDEAAEKINQIIATNFTGLVHVTRASIKLMKKSNEYSLIVNINSLYGLRIPYTGMSVCVYPASKYAITGFSESLRQELITTNVDKIRVTNLSPGVVASEIIVNGGYTNNPDEFYGAFAYFKCEEIGNAVVYLLSTPTNVNVTQLTIQAVGEKI